ncbi:MAG: hypothetical protein J7M01_02745 [Candidatus Marinimicrobia bacterium]|nr:hypothetical protein [Candidatus Neomarinimicrobiota bacterium]
MNKPTQEQIDNLDLFEIYVYNSEIITSGHYEGSPPGEVSGWEIKWVLATDAGIKTFPFFDCIITKNDNSCDDLKNAIIWR